MNGELILLEKPDTGELLKVIEEQKYAGYHLTLNTSKGLIGVQTIFVGETRKNNDICFLGRVITASDKRDIRKLITGIIPLGEIGWKNAIKILRRNFFYSR